MWHHDRRTYHSKEAENWWENHYYTYSTWISSCILSYPIFDKVSSPQDYKNKWTPFFKWAIITELPPVTLSRVLEQVLRRDPYARKVLALNHRKQRPNTIFILASELPLMKLLWMTLSSSTSFRWLHLPSPSCTVLWHYNYVCYLLFLVFFRVRWSVIF